MMPRSGGTTHGMHSETEHGMRGHGELPGNEIFDVSSVGDFMMSAAVPSA